MHSTLSLVLVFLNKFFTPRHNAQLRLMKAQVAILRARIPTQRIILSPAEKAELIRIGAEIGHDIDGLMEVAKPATYKRWLAQTRSGRPFKAVGRPRLTQELRDVVTRIGSENLLWGYKRIVGELKKLGLYAGANSVKRILNEAGIHPSPERRNKKPALPWSTFISAHMESMVACDFFTKTVFTLRGPRTAYVLMFIHLGSRRVYCSAPSYSPDSAWVTQQARNTLMWCAEQGILPSLLIRDADTKFSASFDAVWTSEGARIIQTPHRAPDANAFAESFIGTIKRECLNFFVCLSRSQLDYILRTWVRHYNVDRPHRGRDIGNNVLQVDFRPARDGPIRCNRQLGGIVTSYTRCAA
ncbi:integrase core domain-containing protein [Shimia litoralis]|nr:integrase core domain-containing protein [Shimia litoralis]